jgi:hypothetical protein
MTWPAQSPNLNIIENLGLCIKRSLQNAAGNINTPQELFTEFFNYAGLMDRGIVVLETIRFVGKVMG